jgi:hypothetical protein
VIFHSHFDLTIWDDFTGLCDLDLKQDMEQDDWTYGFWIGLTEQFWNGIIVGLKDILV